MPSPGSLNDQGDALVALLAGIHPDVTDASIVARGSPACLPALIIRPLAGEGAAAGGGGCTCETRWGVFVLADAALDCLENSQALVNELASNCGEHSIPATLKPNRKTPTPLNVTVDDAPAALGAAIHAVEPATQFGLTQFNTDGAPNAYGAVIPVVIRYHCC